MRSKKISFGGIVEGSLIGTFVLIGLMLLFYVLIILASYVVSQDLPYTDGLGIWIGRFALEPIWIDAIFLCFYVAAGIKAGWFSSRNVDRKLTAGLLSGLLVTLWFGVFRFVFSFGSAIVTGLLSRSLFISLVQFFASVLRGAPFTMVAFLISAAGTTAGGVFGSYLRWSPRIRVVIKK